MKTTDYIVQAVKTEGITHIFMVPGGLIDPFLSAFDRVPGVAPIVAAHESGAAYMADGYARGSGKFGVCFCIGGPGITNAVTALATALTDEFPLLLMSGQVPTDWDGRGGFQDSSAASYDDVDILRTVTADELCVDDIRLLKFDLHRLMTRMLSTPHKPVHLVLPKNIQNADVDFVYGKLPASLATPRLLDIQAAMQFAPVLGQTRKVVILAGAGIEKSEASGDLLAFAERFRIPVATTLRAKGVFPEDHPLALGIFGYSGTRHAIETILSDEVETLIVLGSGLNQRDTLFWSEKFRPSKALIHVDNDTLSIGRTYHTELPVVGDCGEFLRFVGADDSAAAALAAGAADREAWMARIRASGPRLYDAENMTSDANPIHPARVIADLRKVMPRNTVMLVDSGAHRAFAGHYWESYAPREYISATNLGPMGWAIPAAIGAKLAQPDKPHVVVTGDGCMLMHGIEIQTAARFGVKVIFVLINNSALGNVYLRAKTMGPTPTRLTENPTHDWAGFARSLGLHGITVTEPGSLVTAFEQARDHDGPVLLDIRCGRDFKTPVAPFAQSAKEWTDHD
ncbi:thiamine pyrophosphate-binding protein [Oscillatoria amoena NRMC-F 0135]|nr:thiamine pyrophosphate-binding protein [Oscillatoria laete-virens]MDL5051059.1 thiamine pyrophosphate-binding protein [Oscillatoria amoena NRMC-F 0135]MDL5054506.1 thiamine pyrophosphate-binding protein [Oscillatoria laete-virens NRMC-F 0139]